jgi:CrcB protein
VGLLGGFTTFSAFSLETLRLMEHQPLLAGLYAGASVVLSVGACWIGFSLGRV